jgi:hypothetical protein
MSPRGGMATMEERKILLVLPGIKPHNVLPTETEPSPFLIAIHISKDRGVSPGRGKRFFSSPQSPDRPWGSPRCTGGCFPGGKTTGVWRLSLASTWYRGQEEWSCISAPLYAFMVWCLIKHRNNYAFYFLMRLLVSRL